MNSVGNSASGVRHALAQRALTEQPGLAHAVTSCTSPATGRGCGRSRRGTRRRAWGRLGEARRSRSSAFSSRGVPSRTMRPSSMIAEPVAELVGLLEVLGREEHRRAALVDPPHLVPDREPARRVEPGRGLVEEQHLGLVDERRGEVEPPLHPARVALDAAVGRVLELDEREQLAARAAASAARGRTAAPGGRAARARSAAGRAPPPGARRRCGAAPRRARAPRRRRPPGPCPT